MTIAPLPKLETRNPETFMRLAIIADIHSNLEALDSVLTRIDREGVESILNLGDLVGYNASPNECLELLQSRRSGVWRETMTWPCSIRSGPRTSTSSPTRP